MTSTNAANRNAAHGQSERGRRVRSAALLLCPLLLCGGLAGCSDVDKAIAGMSLETPPKTDAPAELEARFQDPLAASQLREKAWDMLSVMTRDADPQVRANALEAMAKTPQRLEPLLI